MITGMYCTLFCEMLEEKGKEREAICFCLGQISYFPCDGFILEKFRVFVEECVCLLVYKKDAVSLISSLYLLL